MGEYENITVRKEALEHFVVDLERLLADFERVLDTSLQMEAENRLHEMKKGEVRPLGEEDYKKFMKKMGIGNG